MLLPSATEGEAAMLQRLERLERRVTAGGTPAPGMAAAAVPAAPVAAQPAPAPAAVLPPAPALSSNGGYQRPSQRPAEAAPAAEPVAPQPKPSATPVEQPAVRAEPAAESTGGIDAAAVRRVWPDLLAAIRKIPGGRSTEAMLTQATVYSVDGSAVTLTHNAEPLARRLSELHNAEKIAAALHTVLGGEWQVRCGHGTPAAAPAKASAPAARPQAAAPPAGQQRSYSRPSAAPAAPAAELVRQDRPPAQVERPAPKPVPVLAEPDIPLPPEPVEDEDMYSEDSSPAPPAPVTETEDAQAALAHKLLSEHLGARQLD
jgi:DNA polymerase-3 subunit gamma/tau